MTTSPKPSLDPAAVEAAVLAHEELLLGWKPSRKTYGADHWRRLVTEMSAALTAYEAARSPWHRTPDVPPPRDGALFEVRLDGEPGRRHFCTLHPDPWSASSAAVDLTFVPFGRVLPSDDYGNFFPPSTSDPETWLSLPGWWRLLPDDEPPAGEHGA